MLKESLIVVLVPLAALALVMFPRRARATADASSSAPATSSPAWALPASAAPYRVTIAAAEYRNGIPSGLLGRLLYQESRFRPDIIDGRVKSRAGAVGIAQIVPRWHPTVNPLDPYASIDYAADYLAKLHRRFGAWPLALAAYNWGPTNLDNALAASADWRDQAPAETRAYVTDITRDVRGLA